MIMTIIIIPGGEDFAAITNHQLTFSPNEISLPVPINISSDGNFEENETFSLILSVRDFHLQLNNGTAINLRQSVCKDEGIFSISNSDTQRDETVNIDLDRIFVSQTDNGNGFTFSLAATESERISIYPANTNVTICDNDSKLLISMIEPLRKCTVGWVLIARF